MPRPYIGPVIDFRIPGDVKVIVEEEAARAGRPVDELCRELFVGAVLVRWPASTRPYSLDRE